MKKAYLGAWMLLLVMATAWAADDALKIPSDVYVRIQRVLLDQARTQSNMAQLQIQYSTFQQTLDHDNKELESLKAEALTAARLEKEKYDVDVEKGVFVPRPTAPAQRK